MQSVSKWVLSIVIVGLIACKGDSKKEASPTASKPNATVTAPETTGPEIPGVPEQVMVKLLNECTYVDYIFHKLPFSLSQSEDNAIDQNISFIDFKRPLVRIPKDCKPIGRKFFQIKGEIVYDVDVYLTNYCKFYVFVDKTNKPIYANYMTDAGVNFYANVAQQARGTIPQQ
ncbi:MAG: hypothetical protein IPN89_04315 [Saprospiraceae bacterium]|nr:hypothetical protein [Saprospiraceae bacterium]